MQPGFSKEQQLLRQVVAGFLSKASDTATVRRLMDTDLGYDPAVWERLCTEAELAGTHLPEDYGGVGLCPVELGIVTEEMGRYLFCGPFFSSSVMAEYALLLAANPEAKRSHLPGLAAGSELATLVLDDLDGPQNVGRRIESRRSNELRGTAPLVLDAHVASRLLVVAREEETIGLFSLDRSTPGVQIQPVKALDPTRKLSRVEFKNAQSKKVGELNPEVLDTLWDSICTALAHEMIGGAQHLLESTVEYTKVRHQFGRPIGSFQALKHRCADLLMEVELARAVTHHAARCLGSGNGEPYAASMAKAMASDAYMSAARTAIQLRGGIGFTWEDDTHLWFKRAKSSEVFMGTPHLHRERMMTMVEAEA